jgi:hypothetical protein
MIKHLYGATLLSLCVCCGVLLAAGPQASVPVTKHPRLHFALHELREARRELKEAAHDFGGHRLKALEAVEAAIVQVKKCLEAVGEKPTGLAPKAEVYKKYKHFPHIHHALHELREAKHALEKAPHDFGGHRLQAIRDIDRAIHQLEEAIRFAVRR